MTGNYHPGKLVKLSIKNSISLGPISMLVFCKCVPTFCLRHLVLGITLEADQLVKLSVLATFVKGLKQRN